MYLTIEHLWYPRFLWTTDSKHFFASKISLEVWFEWRCGNAHLKNTPFENNWDFDFFFQTALILGPSEIIFTEGYEGTSTFFLIIVTINEL